MRFFVACPANYATGGTELLHQFCALLTKKGIENYMVYLDVQQMCPTPDRFMKYEVKYVSEYIDSEESVLVLLETRVHLSKWCKKGIIIIWWLSVDCYLNAYGIKKDFGDIFDLKSRTNIFHYVQSYYAEQFLKDNLGIEKSGYLRDYINDDIIRLAIKNQNSNVRKNYILYNPKKGYENIRPLIELSRDDVEWKPLINYTPEEMAMLMLQSKIYIDFGCHPGKDRIPREAAICGCCVLTNREGSAKYNQDVNIPDEYRFDDMQNIERVLKTVYDIIDNYEEKIPLYQKYREDILREKEMFDLDVHCMLKALNGMEMKLQNGKNTKFDIERYMDILISLRDAMFKIESKVSTIYTEDSNTQVMKSLLEMDYMINIVKETLYSIMNDMS